MLISPTPAIVSSVRMEMITSGFIYRHVRELVQIGHCASDYSEVNTVKPVILCSRAVFAKMKFAIFIIVYIVVPHVPL